ncbi:MAG TPA: DUF1003 domain-containing protein, partial [Chloroflexota bacterium]|nr:DUF1003 domain-containing protein [Chloroflexota bacterium]
AEPVDEHVGFNGRLAAGLTKTVGSMWAVYFTTLFVLSWCALATFGPLHASDPYPFPFLLFIGNVVQLLLVFVILVGQSILGRAADKRAIETYDDAEEIFREIVKLHDHLVEQDQILSRGISLVETQPHPWIADRKVTPPPVVKDMYVGLNGRIAAWITQKVGTMWAFYIATIFQFGWIGLSYAGLIRFDPYPFAFLLFLSSLTQLIFMFIIMVGQEVLGGAGEKRAQQTFLDGEAVLHECLRLQKHLTAQDKLIVKICGYIADNAPANHPIRETIGSPVGDPSAVAPSSDSRRGETSPSESQGQET